MGGAMGTPGTYSTPHSNPIAQHGGLKPNIIEGSPRPQFSAMLIRFDLGINGRPYRVMTTCRQLVVWENPAVPQVWLHAQANSTTFKRTSVPSHPGNSFKRPDDTSATLGLRRCRPAWFFPSERRLPGDIPEPPACSPAQAPHGCLYYFGERTVGSPSL